MTLKNVHHVALLSILSVIVSACASLPACKTTEPVAEPAPPQPAQVVVPPPEPQRVEPPKREDFLVVEDAEGNERKVAVGPGGQALGDDFKFELDKSDIGAGDMRVLQQHAQVLVRNRDARLRIEGHCDERGTREYNLALGERRAAAVADFLFSAGVRQSQITTVSFGEETPIDPRSTEEAWAKNRRVVLTYE